MLVTAYSRDDVMRASAGLRLAGVLQKPVTPSSLCDCLMQIGARTHASRPAPASPVDPTGRLRARLAGARILLVEDHPVNQELAVEVIRRAGMQVVAAANGQEALHRLKDDGPFDGVLMDCQMPVMDGYTATRVLRSNPAWRELPVIAMTASALASDRERAFASGMNAHIAKPLDVEAMLRTMAEWIAGPGAAPHRDAAQTSAWPFGGMNGAIDTVDGLARCLGNTELYRRMLSGFRRTQADLEASLHAASAWSSTDELLRRLHDLQGLAGSIGAKALQAAAQALHAAVSTGDRALAEVRRAHLAAELHDAMQEIDRMLLVDSA
jgi:CheY-like chemotaxis protein